MISKSVLVFLLPSLVLSVWACKITWWDGMRPEDTWFPVAANVNAFVIVVLGLWPLRRVHTGGALPPPSTWFYSWRPCRCYLCGGAIAGNYRRVPGRWFDIGYDGAATCDGCRHADVKRE